MSGHDVLADALAATLGGHAPLMGAINGVFDAAPARAVRPYVLIDETVLTDWSTKDLAGREGRISILLYDTVERTTQARTLIGEIDTAFAAMPRALAGGWRIASLVPARSRIVREGEGRLVGVIEYRVRMLREA